MLIPDAVDWILGTWAKEITKWNSEKCDFVIFPIAEVWENPELFRSVLEHMDGLHCLTQSGFNRIRAAINKTGIRHVKVISTVHHIVKPSQIIDCLKADTIMVVCQKYFSELMSDGVARDRLVLVYNGVDANVFSPGDKVEAKKSFGISAEALTIGFAAKATSDHDGRKGIDVLIRTLSMLPDRIERKVHVILTGPGWGKLQTNGSFNRVSLHYSPFLPRSRMPDFYNALDVYLVTARVEGGPVPLLEAMSCGVPVVTTPVGTALDFVRDSQNGIMIPLDDVEKAIIAIKLIHYDRSLASRLGSAGRDTILRNLQWKDTAPKAEYLYRQLKSSPDRTSRNRTTSVSYEKLTEMLIEKDEQRWRRSTGQEPLMRRPWSKRLISLQNRLYSRVGRSLWSGGD